MKLGDRVEVVLTHDSGEGYQRGEIVAVHHFANEPRFDVRVDSGTIIHSCRESSLREAEEQ